MSTHRGKKVRVSKKNKQRLEAARDDFNLNSQDEVIDLLFDSSFTVNKKKKKPHDNFML